MLNLHIFAIEMAQLISKEAYDKQLQIKDDMRVLVDDILRSQERYTATGIPIRPWQCLRTGTQPSCGEGLSKFFLPA